MSRRSWISLNGYGNTRCVVKFADGTDIARLGAYELTCVKKRELIRRGNDPWAVGPLPHDVVTAKRVAHLLSGNCCYAFYAKPTHAVKIGWATNLLRRWSEHEHGSGMPLQLLMVWKTNDYKSFETKLHDRFAAYRGLGEWFSADGILAGLINEAAGGHSVQRTDDPRGTAVAS
jgi:Meiotically up-regulated gene 113